MFLKNIWESTVIVQTLMRISFHQIRPVDIAVLHQVVEHLTLGFIQDGDFVDLFHVDHVDWLKMNFFIYLFSQHTHQARSIESPDS